VHLVEILLPLADNEGKRFDKQKYAAVREELSKRFAGVTAFARAPPTASAKPAASPCMTTSSFMR
jgi:hypothetical protein